MGNEGDFYIEFYKRLLWNDKRNIYFDSLLWLCHPSGNALEAYLLSFLVMGTLVLPMWMGSNKKK